MIDYIMEHGSNQLRAVICKMIAKGFDIEDYRTMMMIGLISENVKDGLIYEYEKLHDNYYLEVKHDLI